MSTIVKITLDPTKDAAIIAFLEQQKDATGRTGSSIAKDLLISGIDVETIIIDTINATLEATIGSIEAKVKQSIIEAFAPLLVTILDQNIKNGTNFVPNSEKVVKISDQNGDNGHNSDEDINPFSDW